MNLSIIKQLLHTVENVSFELEDGAFVPAHFHVTEIGVITKDFIDCGGIIRHERTINFQLWNANDTDHRLKPAKLLDLITLSEEKLGLEDLEAQVTYQGKTIEEYGLDFNGRNFLLVPKTTNCLAKDRCGIPSEKLNTSPTEKTTCTPGGGCC
jgi:hypothetical protein